MLKPYEKYQTTKYDWLATVPKHWTKHTIRSITKVSDMKNGSRKDLELLSVYREYGVIKKSSRDDNHNVESQDLSNYKYVGTNYLVMNKMKMWQGSLGVSQYEGIVSPAYIVCKITQELNPSYLHFLLRSPLFKTYYNRISYGVRVGQWDMRYDNFKGLELYLPPLEEQDQIVRYLDWKLSKINKLIKAKKKQIELLNEQKQAIINKAVTKGLDDTVPMKDSGIAWIGSIPTQWDIVKIRRCFTSILGKMLAPAQKSKNETYEPYFCAKDIHFDSVNTSDLKYMWFSETEKKQYQVRVGDLLVVEGGAGAGGASIYQEDILAYIQNSVHLIREKGQCLNQYLCFWLQSIVKRGYIDYSCNKATIPHFTKEKLLDVLLPLPSNAEQVQICFYLKAITQRIDNLVSRLKTEIDYIQEYRHSLISAVVTGKVDVRDIEIPEFELEEVLIEETMDEESDESGELEEV